MTASLQEPSTRHAIRAVPASLLALGSVVAACQWVGGIDDRFVDPNLYLAGTDAGSDGPADGEPSGCSFEDDGGVAVRFVHAAAGADAVDLCVKATGVGDWPPRPVSRGIGSDCHRGVPYRFVTAPRHVASRTVDLKVVSASSPDCSAPALAQLPSVGLPDSTTTVIYASRGGSPMLVALPEKPPSTTETVTRFLHFIDGVDLIDVVRADTSVWPPSPDLVFVSGIAFGQPPSGPTESGGTFIGDGYLSYYVSSGEQTFGVLRHQAGDTHDAGAPSDDWLAVVRRQWPVQTVQSVFAVGRIGDPEYPPELIDCDEGVDDGVWTRCRARGAHDLRVAVLHTTLGGAEFPAWRERAAQLPSVVAEADAQVMCLAFVMSDEDKRAVEQAAVAAGFHVAWAEMDLSTPIDDPRRFDGSIPAPPSAPPCDGPVSLQVVDDILGCVADHCTDGKGEEGGIRTTACLSEQCITVLLAPLAQSEDQQRCATCLVFAMLDGSAIRDVRQACTTDPNAGLAFGGKSGVMLLSKLPVRDVTHRALPSWVWRASVTAATVELPTGQAADLYCTQLSTSERPPPFRYLGPYGDGPLGDNHPWTNETLLQSRQVREFVRQRSGPRPALVVGAIESGLDCPTCQPPLGAFGPEVLTDMLTGLGLGTAPDYHPQCLECADNALRQLFGHSEVNLWTDQILLHAVTRLDVLSTTRTFDSLSMSVPVDDTSVPVPPSTHYGLRSVVRIW